MVREKIYNIYFFIICFLLVFPINIVQSNDVQIALPISLVLVIPSLKYFILLRDKDKKYFIFCIIFSLLSISIIGILKGITSFKPYFSLLFFCLPITLYFWVSRYICSEKKFSQVLRYLSINTIVFTIIYSASIFIKHSGIVRTEGTLNGDILGLQLTGAYGVHTLGTHLFILVFVLLYAIHYKVHSKVLNIVSIVCLLLLTYIIIVSLSRELVLGLLLLYPLYFLRKWGVFSSVLFFTTVIVLVYFTLGDLINSILKIWESKIAMSKTDDLNELSSGRFDLYYLAFEQLGNNPLFGTGFQGYTLDYMSYKGYDNLEGWSTHIYLLTILWKMGILAFIPFMIFMYRIVNKVRNNHSLQMKDRKIYFVFIIAFGVVNLFWDALLAPNIMMLFIFIIGMFNFNQSVIK